jgi:hypothetical protein
LTGGFNGRQVDLQRLGLGELMEFEAESWHRRLPFETGMPRQTFRSGNALTFQPLGLHKFGDTDMAIKQGKNDNRLSDKEAMHLAETTDVSPKQAKDLAEKHGKAKAVKEAKNFKAEG